MKVAVLDDDPEQVSTIVSVVEANGFRAAGYSRSAALLSAMRRETFDLLIVDWALPDRSGLEVIRWVRLNVAPPPPMLLVTARTDDADVVAGLQAGADDYLAKPISTPVLAARIAALLRRAYPRQPEDKLEVHADIAFDPASSTVFVKDKPVILTAKEFALATVLFRNMQRALSRSYLIEAVWGGDPGVNSRSLDVHISRIRSKLRLRAEEGFRLTPVYSYGYRLERLGTDRAQHPEKT